MHEQARDVRSDSADLVDRHPAPFLSEPTARVHLFRIESVPRIVLETVKNEPESMRSYLFR